MNYNNVESINSVHYTITLF